MNDVLLKKQCFGDCRRWIEMMESAYTTEGNIGALLEKIKSKEEFPLIDFIILYGSLAQRKGNESSDIDICVSFRGKKEDMSNFRLKLLTELCDDSYDVQIFQQLPLYVQIEILKGKVLYARDKKILNDMALETIREFDLFKRHYYDYIYG